MSVPLYKYSHGFTIIEMMVSLALFTIVITIAAGAFLSLIGGSGKLQGEQSIMTSLSFAMDIMTREIRTGTKYYCHADGADNIVPQEFKDCPAGATAISFKEAGTSLTGVGGGRISYSYESDENPLVKTIFRRVELGVEQSIFSSDIRLKSAR